MFDYRGIEALSAILKCQSFEKAATELRITQSAVSQRIKNLENYFGEPLLVRTLPYCATPLGGQLLRLLAQVQILERNFAIERGEQVSKPKISIALNRDSLETWFLHEVGKSFSFDEVVIEILADDQELTLDYFRRGLVSACLSTQEKPLPGAKACYLGAMTYVLAASPKFMEQYQLAQHPSVFFENAPALKFDQNDHLHERYLATLFPKVHDVPYQIIPSVVGFKKYALLGYGYGLIPEIDVEKELNSGKLVNIMAGKALDVHLYWHTWSIDSEPYQNINARIVACARKRLGYSGLQN